MLVRHVLSQLSYAPKPSSEAPRTSATWFIIHTGGYFVKHFFSFSAKHFLRDKRVEFRLAEDEPSLHTHRKFPVCELFSFFDVELRYVNEAIMLSS